MPKHPNYHRAPLCSSLLAAVLLTGCVGSPIHETSTYNSIQSVVKRNTAALLNLQAGMDKPGVETALGKPARSEGYPWGSVWFYRTMMSAGAYDIPESDFTPLVFNSTGKLEGWGRNYFTERTRSYRVEITGPRADPFNRKVTNYTTWTPLQMDAQLEIISIILRWLDDNANGGNFDHEGRIVHVPKSDIPGYRTYFELNRDAILAEQKRRATRN
jgi:outer membrane protein assembly factor BamE (lipoprotein component of BamABCDE complex)